MNLHLRKIVTSTRVTLCISVLFLLEHFHIVKGRECVKRLEGACKVVDLTDLYSDISDLIYVEDFHSPQPDGYLLKTTVEVMLKANKHNFEKTLNEEIRRPVVVNNKWKPVELRISLETSKEEQRIIRVVSINFIETMKSLFETDMNTSCILNIRSKTLRGMDSLKRIFLVTDLGLKYDRMARFTYWMFDDNYDPVTLVQKWNNFTPILPRFPYRLRLQVTTNGIFSVYADGNHEPFFEHQIEVELIGVSFIHIHPVYEDEELVALVDCSSIGAPNCGSHHIDRLYDCRESLVQSYGWIGLKDLTKKNNESKIFDEYFIVDPTAQPMFMFEYADDYNIEIEFNPDGMLARLKNYGTSIKTATTVKWYQIPSSPCALRVEMFAGNTNTSMKISNIQGDEFLQINTCGRGLSLEKLTIYPSLKTKKFSPIYFDCIHPDRPFNGTRPRKYGTDRYSSVFYNETGYNYTKEFLDTQNFFDENVPDVLYEDASGHISKDDWCHGESQPELYVKHTKENEILDIGKLNREILSELKLQNNVTTSAFKTLVSKLESVNQTTSDGLKAIVSELQSIKELTANQTKMNL